ncbi:MAG: BMP family ABC transporter substrate-binding protein, partial [Actinobacteria bacterium]|nr:BMP family ABC transporter substrate-binding protein [Actinomycetota bacterium]
MKKLITAALATVALVVLSACGTPSSPSAGGSGGTSAGKFLGCMVTDTGGIDDKSFNASSWEGMQQAQAADPSKITVKYLSSTSPASYAPNISAFLGRKCGIIVTVGFLMSDATQTAAKANPSAKFAIVDFPKFPQANIDSLVFNTVQDGYLGGYLAAGMTKTGKVATFGGMKLPTVTIYMDGFWDGVQAYNAKHHTHVTVLGWNEQTQAGEFTNSFTNLTAG